MAKKQKRDETEVFVGVVTLSGAAHMRAPAFLADQMATDFVEPRVSALQFKFTSGDTCTIATGKIVSVAKTLVLPMHNKPPKDTLVEYTAIKHYVSDEP